MDTINQNRLNRIAADVLAKFEQNPEAWNDGSEARIRQIIEEWPRLWLNMTTDSAAEAEGNVEE